MTDIERSEPTSAAPTGPPLLGEFAESAAEKFVAILNQQTRAHFRHAFRATERDALAAGIGRGIGAAAAGAAAGAGAEHFPPDLEKPQPLAAMAMTAGERDTLSFSVRKMQEAFIETCKVCDLGSPAGVAARSKLRMFYIEAGQAAEELELIRHPSIHLNKLRHHIVPENRILQPATVTKALAKMRARGRKYRDMHRASDGILTGKMSETLERATAEADVQFEDEFAFENAATAAREAMAVSGTSDPEMRFVFEHSLRKLRSAPSMVDRSIQVRLTPAGGGSASFLCGDSIEIQYHASWPVPETRVPVRLPERFDREIHVSVAAEAAIGASQAPGRNNPVPDDDTKETTHATDPLRRSVSADDMLVVLRDVPSDLVARGKVSALSTLEKYIVARRPVHAGHNNGVIKFDTTDACFAPNPQQDETNYWAVFLQSGFVPRGAPMPLVVRRGNSTLTCPLLVRCGATVLVRFHRVVTELAQEKRMGRSDWIGMYRVDKESDADDPSIKKLYLHRETLPAPPDNSGSINFVVPGLPGNYEFRLHSGDMSNAVVAVSDIVEAQMRVHAAVGRTKCPRDVRIYLSSAYGDCEEERRVFKQVIEPSVVDFCALVGCNCEVTDLRRHDARERLTKEFSATHSITPRMLADEMHVGLRDAMGADIFVCLLGDRYGFVPPKNAVTERFKTIHPWITAHSKLNPYVLASKKGCGLSLFEMEIQQAFLIPLEMFGPRAVRNCIFFFRSPEVRSQIPLDKQWELPERTQERAINHLKSLIFSAKAGHIFEGHFNADRFRELCQRHLCSTIRFEHFSSKRESEEQEQRKLETRQIVPAVHLATREEMAAFSTNLRDRWVTGLSPSRLWSHQRQCSSGAAEDAGAATIMSRLNLLLNCDYEDEFYPAKALQRRKEKERWQADRLKTKRSAEKRGVAENEDDDDDVTSAKEEALKASMNLIPDEYIQMKDADKYALDLLEEYVEEAETTHIEEDGSEDSDDSMVAQKLERQDATSSGPSGKPHVSDFHHNSRRPVIIVSVPGAGASSFLSMWIEAKRERLQQIHTTVIMASIGETATALDTTPALFRFLAWEVLILTDNIKPPFHGKCPGPRFLDLSDEQLIRRFGPDLLDTVFRHKEHAEDKHRRRLVLCLDGISRLRDRKRFPPSSWLPTLFRPHIACVLTLSAVPLRSTNKSDGGSSLAADKSLLNFAVSERWLIPRRVILIDDIHKKDSELMVERFRRSFADCTLEDSSKYGAGAVAFVEKGNTLLSMATKRILKSPCTVNLRMLTGVMESVDSYDTPMDILQNVSRMLGDVGRAEPPAAVAPAAESNDSKHSITSIKQKRPTPPPSTCIGFYCEMIRICERRFPLKARRGLRFLCLATQGLTERELRLALNADGDRVEWLRFANLIEPALVVRSGVFINLANRHVRDAVLCGFDSEEERAKVCFDLVKFWEDLVRRLGDKDDTILMRARKERPTLLMRIISSAPSLIAVHPKKFQHVGWTAEQGYNKLRSLARDLLWEHLSAWASLSVSFGSIRSRHDLLHFLRTLPQHRGSADFISRAQAGFVAHFRLPNNFFRLRNLFCGAKMNRRMFKPTRAAAMGQGLVQLCRFVTELKHRFKHGDGKLLPKSTRLPKHAVGFPLLKDDNENFQSSARVPQEELSIMERCLLVFLGIPSFNQCKDVDLTSRFFAPGTGLGKPSVLHFIDALEIAAKAMRLELLGAAQLLLSFRHRVVLAPLATTGPRAHVERRLLNRLSPLCNTVLMDSVSTTVKTIVNRLQFNLMNLKAVLISLVRNDLAGAETSRVRAVLALVVESLGAA